MYIQLSQEKSLDRRLLLRKELRIRRNTSALTRAVSQVHEQLEKGVESPVIQSSRMKIFAVQPSVEKNDDIASNKTNIKEEKPQTSFYSTEIQKELEKFLKELRNTLDLNKRRDLRIKIKELHSNMNLNFNSTKHDPQLKDMDEVDKSKKSTIVIHQQTDKDILNKMQNKIPTKYLISHKLQESHVQTYKEPNRQISANNRKSTLENVAKTQSDHTKVDNFGVKEDAKHHGVSTENASKCEGLMKPSYNVDYKIKELKEDQPKSKKKETIKIKVQEAEDVVLHYDLCAVNIDNKNVAWFYDNRMIETYPKSYFPNLKCIKSNGNSVKLQFSDASVKKHQGIFRLEINSKSFILEVLFEITIENVIMKEGSNNSYNIVNKSERKETPSNIMINKSLSDVDKKLSSKMKQSEIKSISETIPTEIKKTNVSRVSSMREMFERKPESDNLGHNLNKDIKRKVGIGAPLIKELEELIKEEDSKAVDVKAVPPLMSSDVCQGTLEPPFQASRKISQAGIMKMIPMMKSKAKIARSSVQQMKDLILNFCKYNTEEYENVNITNYSGSWADGLAFCALIHHFYPDAFDYSKLTTNNRSNNFNLAFETAKERAGIDPLLDPEDMVIFETPDWKCVYTYVQLMYSKLKTHPRNALSKVAEPNF